MEKVFLVGDSVREGYDRFVRDRLSGQAEVYYPRENCRFAQYVLRHFHEWVQADCDPNTVTVVHWNAGLWDTGRLFEDEMLTPLDFYVDTLRRIHKRICKICPNAKIIFATSTPVREELYTPERFMRYNRDIEIYNAAAVKALRELGEEIDDLYETASKLDKDAWSDCTHLYTEIGTKTLGTQVCKAITQAFAK